MNDDDLEELRSLIFSGWVGSDWPRAYGESESAQERQWELSAGAAADAVLAAGYVKPDLQPGRWWRVIAPDGLLWVETSNESEARERMRPGDRLERLHVAQVSEWRQTP